MALQRLYGENGERLAAMAAGREPTPLLSDLAAALTTVVTDEGLDEVRPLARQLAFFLRTTKGRRFGAQTTIPWRFDADVISYSFENVPNNVLPIFYVVIFEGLDRYVRTRPPTAKRFIACIDEFKLMAQVPALRRYAEGATRWWRQAGRGSSSLPSRRRSSSPRSASWSIPTSPRAPARSSAAVISCG